MEVTMPLKIRGNVHFSVIALLLFLAGSIAIHAQAPGDGPRPGLPGRHTVTGIIYTPDRVPAGRGISIRLVSNNGYEHSGWSDQDGKFSIAGVGNGTYTISTDAGKDYEYFSQRLEIIFTSGTPPQYVNKDVQLRWKNAAKPLTGIIDAELAGVPVKAQVNYQLAKNLSSNGNHQGAVDQLLKAITEYPEFMAAQTELGAQYQKLNQLEKSEIHLRVALRLKPGSYKALASLGVLLVRLKRFDEAETTLREALKIKDDSAVVHFYLGRALVGQKRPVEAETEFRSALAMGGNEMIESRRALANIYIARGENEKAVTELEAYLLVNPTPADEKQLRDTLLQVKELMKGNNKP